MGSSSSRAYGCRARVKTMMGFCSGLETATPMTWRQMTVRPNQCDAKILVMKGLNYRKRPIEWLALVGCVDDEPRMLLSHIVRNERERELH